jgi:membrane-bound lytic murein transglycosylase D
MPTGSYGLARNAYVDERFDPEKSTRAYARYMKFIYDQLGDWYLSMAGYDWGAGNVQRAVQKTGYADFWELYKRNNLPAETKNYVPEILAAIIIANNPTQYGFDDVTLDPPILTDTVTINYSVDLRLVADVVDAPVDELTALNPSLLRLASPPEGSFDLHLPAGTGALYQQRIAAVPETRRASWRYHRVGADDTLASVAHQFHVSQSLLADANQLGSKDSLQGVEALAIPVAPVAAAFTHPLLYTARRGDTLVTIADRFGVSLTQLRNWNKMNGVKIEPGRRLHIAEPGGTAYSSRSRRHGATASAEREPTPSANGSAHKPASASTSRKAATLAAPVNQAAKPHSTKSASKNQASGSAASSGKKSSASSRSAHSNSPTQ